MPEHFAGNCALCGEAIDRQVLDDWCSSVPPFCWKCGTFYDSEGNRWGLDAASAIEKAAAFDARIDAAIQAARIGGSDG